MLSIIFQTLKHVQNISDFNTISNPCSYLALFVPKTLLVVWYFIMDLISSDYFLQTPQNYLNFTWSFLLSDLNSYLVFYY